MNCVVLRARSSRLALAIALAVAFAYPALAAASLVRVKAYDLDVTFQPDQAMMQGKAAIEFQPTDTAVDTLTFYLHGELYVTAARLGGAPVQPSQELVLYPSDYSCVANKVRIPLEGGRPPQSLEVEYRGYCSPSRVRAPSNYMRIDPGGVFLRSYPYSVWFPVFLEAGEETYTVSFPKVVLRTPEEFTCVFTGTRLGDTTEDGMKISTWTAENVDLFTAQCTARPYTVLQDGSYHIYSLKDPDSEAAAAKILSVARELEAKYRRSYRNSAHAAQLHLMQMPEYGDISSGNVVGLSDENWAGFGENPYNALTLAHELVHPFVQVPIGMVDPMYALVIEGFPSYFHLPILTEIYGAEFYDRMFQNWFEKGYLKKRQDGLDLRDRPVPREKPILQVTAEEVGEYKDAFVLSDRVPLFLNYLRVKMGPERFYDFTRELLNLDRMDYRAFEATALRFLPDAREDLRIWLRTTKYPERFHLAGLSSGKD